MKFQYRRLARVNPRMGAEFRLRPGLWAACRRRAGRAGRVPWKWLRAFTSSYERLQAGTIVYERVRARRVAFRRVRSRQVARNTLFSCSGTFGRVVFTSVFERARSRLVAFSRVWSRLVAPNFFFVFGHVRARLGVFFRHFSSFLVIFRHSSSQNGFFGNGGQRVVAALAGQGGQQFAAHGSRAGRRMGKMAWYSFEIGMQLRQGRGCARSSCAQVYYRSGAFAVPGDSRVYLRMGERF